MNNHISSVFFYHIIHALHTEAVEFCVLLGGNWKTIGKLNFLSAVIGDLHAHVIVRLMDIKADAPDEDR